jgi:8-oxo-dGTP pyrophosphatase MutT (NUDIX family)
MNQLKEFEELLSDFKPFDQKEELDSKRLKEFFKSNQANAFSNENFNDGHITGSAFIFDPVNQKLLLLHHKKLNRWLQPGGHSDGSPDIVATAEREVLEETGVREFFCDNKIFDIDIHFIPARPDKPEHYHYDVRFLFLTDSTIPLVLNENESNNLEWVSLNEIFNFVDKKDIAFKRVKTKLETIKKI